MRIPQLNALRALEGVARNGSMTRTAHELNLTPSAVSHALKLLEQEVGFSLVMRDGRGVQLTKAGSLYAAEIRKALSIIGNALNTAKESQVKGHFTISCSPGLAIFWLVHKIIEFRELFPDVDLHILCPEKLEDVSDPNVDLFIAYGSGNWRGYVSELLTELEFAPYCSPALLNSGSRLSVPGDLARFPLLHLHSYEDWTRWFSAAGVSNLSAGSGIVMSNMYLVLAAALEGVGIAMGDSIACRRALTQGLLVRPFPLSIRSTEAYYFVGEEDKYQRPISRAFREWVKSNLLT